jgi:hypothetical protein
MKFLRPDITTSQDLSLGALSYTTSIARKHRIERITFHASVAISETITITQISKQGTNYNHVLRVKTLNAEQDYVFIPDSFINNLDGDETKIQCTNANTTGIIYAVIKTSEISV